MRMLNWELQNLKSSILYYSKWNVIFLYDFYNFFEQIHFEKYNQLLLKNTFDIYL